MTDLLLIHVSGNPEKSAGTLKDMLVPMPPINLAYLASYAEKQGFSVAIHDDFLYRDDRMLDEQLHKHQPLLVGFSTYTSTSMERTLELSKRVRQKFPNSKIVMGNIHASYFYEELIQTRATDYVLFGEAEVSLSQLLQAIKSKTPLQSVSGIAYLDGEAVVHTEITTESIHPDSLPFPAWHLLPIEKYDTFFFAKYYTPSLLILGSRGCVFRCSFCVLSTQGGKRRTRSAENIIAEMKYFWEKYGIRQFTFTDPMFPGTPREGIAFCDALIASGLHKKVSWITETRSEVLTIPLLDKLSESNCKMVMLGIESSNPNTSQTLKRNYRKDLNYILDQCRIRGIETTGFFMLGIPGETPADFRATIRFALTSLLTYAKFSVFVPYPGTRVFEEMKANGNIRANELREWSRYTSWPTTDNPTITTHDQKWNQLLIRYQYFGTLLFYLRPYTFIHSIRKMNLADVKMISRHLIEKFFRIFLISSPKPAPSTTKNLS